MSDEQMTECSRTAPGLSQADSETDDAPPRVKSPTEAERERARLRYPSIDVPDTGPIPDPDYEVVVDVELCVPDWVVAAVRARLDHVDDDALDRARVEGMVMEYARASETYQTAAGDDVVELLLSERAPDE